MRLNYTNFVNIPSVHVKVGRDKLIRSGEEQFLDVVGTFRLGDNKSLGTRRRLARIVTYFDDEIFVKLLN